MQLDISINKYLAKTAVYPSQAASMGHTHNDLPNGDFNLALSNHLYVWFFTGVKYSNKNKISNLIMPWILKVPRFGALLSTVALIKRHLPPCTHLKLRLLMKNFRTFEIRIDLRQAGTPSPLFFNCFQQSNYWRMVDIIIVW